MLLSSALLTRPRAVAPTKRRSTRAFRACQWAILRDAGHGVQPGRACSSAGRSRQILSINGSGSAKGISLDIPFPAAGSRGSSAHLVAAGGGQDDGGAAGGGVGRRRSYLASCFLGWWSGVDLVDCVGADGTPLKHISRVSIFYLTPMFLLKKNG